MDANRFDRLVRSFAASGTRRGLLRLLAALPLAGGLASSGDDASEAARRRQRRPTRHRRDQLQEQRKKNKEKKKKCAKAGQAPKKGKRCCQGLVEDATGRCAAASPPSPPAPPCDVCAGGCPFSSVQAAIDAAAPGATITLCAGAFIETVVIAKNLALIGAGDGAGPSNTLLNGAGAGTVVTIEMGSTVSLQNLRITGGDSPDDGGGIRNSGTLSMTGCTVTANTANTGGGGIFNSGAGFGNEATVELIASRVTANTAGGGGGIFNEQFGTVSLTGCTVTANRANDGGGIAIGIGTVNLTDSVVTANLANEDGGGIFSFGTVTLEASSVTANHAETTGGGIHSTGTVSCSPDSTVSDNTAGDPLATSNCNHFGGGTGCATCPA